MNAQKLPFKELKKFKIGLKNIKELENRRLQYDLMLLEEVVRAHVGKDNNATIIAKPNALKKILYVIPKEFKPKLLKQESLSYNKLLKNTFNTQ